jgi:hypothetical protein
MKKSEFKELVKQSVKEALIDEGLLAQVMTEVVKNVTKANLLTAAASTMQTENTSYPEPDDEAIQMMKENQNKAEKYHKKMMEMRERLMGAIEKSSTSSRLNASGVDFFEGTTPMGDAGTPGQAHVPSSPLGGVMPNDAGVDISALTEKMNVWKELIK